MSSGIADRAEGTMESQGMYNLALEQINRNNYRKALALLGEALRIAPQNPLYLSYFGLCMAYSDRGFDQAVRHCRQAVRVRPGDPVTWLNLGRVYRVQGHNQMAYDTLQKAWLVQKNHPGVAAELTRLGIRRPPFLRFLPRSHWLNRHLGRIRAVLERKIVGRRQS